MLQLLVDLLPLLVKVPSVLVVLLDLELLPLRLVHAQSLFEGEGIDLLQDRLQSDQRFLEYFVPVIVSQVDDDGHEHGEGLLLVGLQNVKEVVVLKEAHGSVGHL